MAKAPTKVALIAGAVALALSSVPFAADEPAAPKLVSGATGSMLAETCAGCHGTDGVSAGPASPTIAGMYDESFVETMKGFQDGSIYSTVMGRIAKGYSEDEIKLMATHFAAREFKPAPQEFDVALADKGAKLHDKYCEKCHSEGGKALAKEEDEDDDDEEFNILAGQWVPYLQYAMEDFRADRREMPKKMRSKVDDLIKKAGDDGLKAVFAFYASQQ